MMSDAMKASELIEELQKAIKEIGDHQVEIVCEKGTDIYRAKGYKGFGKYIPATIAIE